MGVRDWLGGWLTKASATYRPVLSVVSPGQPYWTPDNYEALAREGYQTSVYVYAAVGMIAQAVAGVPLILYRDRGGKLTEIDTHPLLNLMNRPNPMQSGTQLRENLIAYRLLSGNSYLERVGPDDTRRPPRELYALRPDRMMVVPGTVENIVAGYEYRAGGAVLPLAPELILHWKTFHPLDDWYGMPPLRAAARSVDQNNVAKAWNVATLQNSARPSGALTYEGSLNDKQVANLRTDIAASWTGSANARRPLLLEKGMTWQQMGMSPVDMDWLEGQKLSAREIAVVYRVPSQLLGDIEGSTQANYQQARKALYTEAVLPLLDNLLDELNRWLVPLFGPDLRLAYDADGIEALSEDRDQVWARTKDAWFLTLNEARGAVGYDETTEHGERYRWEIDYYQRFGMWPGEKPATATTTAGVKALEPASIKAQAEAIEARRAPYYRSVAAQVAQRFDDERKVLRDVVGNGGDVLTALAAQEPEWVKLMQAVYLAVGEDFASEQLLELKSAAGPSHHKALTDSELAATQAAIWAYIEANGPSRAAMIQSTTGKAIIARTKELIAEGADARRLMMAVDAIYEDWMGTAAAEAVTAVQSRSELISVTETVNASGVGQAAGADESGLPLIKEWNSTLDGRVRPTHDAAHGQKVPMAQAFLVGGQEMMHPGDSSLGASGEAVNCRCFQAFALDQSRFGNG